MEQEKKLAEEYGDPFWVKKYKASIFLSKLFEKAVEEEPSGKNVQKGKPSCSKVESKWQLMKDLFHYILLLYIITCCVEM